MNGRKRLRIGCLLFLLSMVVLPGLLVSRQLRQDRLSAQLMTTLKTVQSLSETYYDSEDDKNGQRRASLQRQVRKEEAMAVRLLQEGADPDVRDLTAVKRTFWEEAKFLLKRMLRRQSGSALLPRSALTIAVQADNAVLVTALLKAGANDVNAEFEMNGSHVQYPLVNYGAYNGNLEIVQELCAHGADVHKLSHTYGAEGESILQFALVDSNQNGDIRNQTSDVSVLEHKRRTEIFHLLLAKGATYKANSEEGHTLLLAACEGDLLDVTRELLAAGVPPNAQADWIAYPPEESALDHAVNNDDLALVKLLLQYGASTKDAQLGSPLLFVKSPEVASLLLEHGANIHAVVLHGKRESENALNLACIDGATKVIPFLIAHGLDVNTPGAMDQAAEYGGFETVRLLLQHGAKVGPKSPGADALYFAISEQQFGSARLLLRYGASVNAKDGRPLTEAVAQGDAGMVLELLKRGADVNAGNGEALLAACFECDEDLVDILLQHGADPTVRASDGMTAIQTAKQTAEDPGDADGIVALLKEYGAKR